MTFAINPPNTPLTDGKGMITAPWYRFFAQIQKLVGGDLLQNIVGAPYLTAEATNALPNERVLSAGDGLALTFASQLATLSLEASGVSVGTYGDESHLVRVTFDAFGRAITAEELSLESDNVTEGATNLFYTDARARLALSAGDGIDYDDTTGEIAAKSAGAAPTLTPYIAPTISNPPTQAEVQALADAQEATDAALLALIGLLQANGNLS